MYILKIITFVIRFQKIVSKINFEFRYIRLHFKLSKLDLIIFKTKIIYKYQNIGQNAEPFGSVFH